MIPNFLINDFHSEFNTTDVVFIDRRTNTVIKAKHVLNASTTVSTGYADQIEWNIDLNGIGFLEVARYGPAFEFTDEDIIQLLEDK